MPKKEEQNAIPLVLPIEEISLRPELSSPARFRIQGGQYERDGRTDGRTKEILVSNLGQYLYYIVVGLYNVYPQLVTQYRKEETLLRRSHGGIHYTIQGGIHSILCMEVYTLYYTMHGGIHSFLYMEVYTPYYTGPVNTK